MDNNLLEAINNLIAEVENLRSEVSDLKKINQTLTSSVNVLKDYVSTL